MDSNGLTSEQTEFFGRNGYVVVEGLLSPQELARADDAVHEIVEEQRRLGDDADRLEWEPELVDGERV
ncbi:MAG: phytanoyl-CoA dioxygenase family protein, partial [bacterium]